MAFSLYPSAIATGTIADWLNVVVAAVVGWAVWRLGKRTNSLGEAANALAKQSRELEASAASKQEKLDSAERQLLLIYLTAEISRACGACSNIREIVSTDGFEQDYVSSQELRVLVATKFLDATMPLSQSKFDRIHLIGNPEAGGLVRCHGTLDMLGTAAKVASEIGDDAKENDHLNIMAQIYKAAVPVLVSDLELVMTACKASLADAGLTKRTNPILGN